MDFLKSILQEKNRRRRMEKSKDQINANSEFTLNMLKKKIPFVTAHRCQTQEI